MCGHAALRTATCQAGRAPQTDLLATALQSTTSGWSENSRPGRKSELSLSGKSLLLNYSEPEEVRWTLLPPLLLLLYDVLGLPLLLLLVLPLTLTPTQCSKQADASNPSPSESSSRKRPALGITIPQNPERSRPSLAVSTPHDRNEDEEEMDAAGAVLASCAVCLLARLLLSFE